MKTILLLLLIICTGCASQRENPWRPIPGKQFLYSSNWNNETALTDTITIRDIKCGMVRYTRKNNVTYTIPYRKFIYHVMLIK